MAKFCPSMMCVDFSRLAEEISALEQAGADMFHIDVMDGNFVPNFALGTEDIKAISKLATIPYDVHLMVSSPDDYIERFARLGCSIIYVHAEAPVHLHRTLTRIRASGSQVGVALNPGTPLSAIEEVLADIDVVLMMSVDPGFAGQPFIPATLDKIRRLSAMITARGAATQIAIDGAISPTVVGQLATEVSYFVLGTAGLFNDKANYSQSITQLRALTH